MLGARGVPNPWAGSVDDSHPTCTNHLGIVNLRVHHAMSVSIVKTTFSALVMLVAACFYSKAAVFKTQVEARNSANGAYAQISLWLPDDDHPKRLIVLIWGDRQCSLDSVYDPGWRKLAKASKCGLVACFFGPQASNCHWDRAAGGSGEGLVEGLKELAKISGQEQIVEAPLYLVGDSQGGQFAFSLAGWKSDRVLGFVSIKGGRHEMIGLKDGAHVPGLFCIGENDVPFRIKNIEQIFQAGRELGAPWCLAIEKKGSHDPSPCAQLVYDFILNLALPSDPPGAPIPPVIEKDRNRGANLASNSVFPTKNFAEGWEDFQNAKLKGSAPIPSFGSKLPSELATSTPESIRTSVRSGEMSELLTAKVNPVSASQWDGLRILDRAFLSECKVEILPTSGAVVSLRVNTGDLPLGRFSGVVPIRFLKNGSPVLGALNIPLNADIIGDVFSAPQLIVLPSIHPDRPVESSIIISSRTGVPVTVLSCETPKGVKKVGDSTPKNPLRLTFVFSKNAKNSEQTAAGTIRLRLKTIKEWILTVPYIDPSGSLP